MIDLKFLFVIIVASLCFGLIIGFILRGIFRKNAGSDAKSEIGVPLEAEEHKEDPRDPAYKEVAQLWFDTSDRKLIFQVGEQYFKRADDMSPKDREKLRKVVSGFYHWLEPKETLRQEESKSSQPKQSAKPDTISSLANTMSQKDENSPNMDLDSINQQKQALMLDISPSALFSQSMVSQVDAILQEKIHRAGMENWAIRLTEFPQRGMVIMVGMEQYDSLEDVPYEQARNIIRESISEWEQRADIRGLTQ